VALGRTLSDPIREQMLGMRAEGGGCCNLPDCGVPARDQDAGICVCEFERYFDAGQSKVSYHPAKLKEAGLVHEERQMELLLARPDGRRTTPRRDRGPSGRQPRQ
jgi:DNA-binding transcriptional ArsR family regulator